MPTSTSTSMAMPTTPATKATPTKFILPDLVGHCTFTLRDNLHSAPVSRASEEWLLADTSFAPQKRARFLRLLAGELTAMCYPDTDADHLRVCSDFMNFLFNLDDWSDEFDEDSTHGLAATVMHVLKTPETFETDKIVGAKTRSIWTRMQKTAAPGCQKRFVDTFDLFFRAVEQQARDRRNGVVPDLEEYVTLRRDTSGCKPCFALVEYAGGLDLPDFVMEHPLIQSLDQATNDLVTWSNDIFSFKVEHERGDTHNMIVVLMEQRGITLQEAVDVVGDFCKQAIDTFSADRATLLSSVSPAWGAKIDADVRTYVQGLQDWIVGSLHWSFMTGRYFQEDGAEVKASRVITLFPPGPAPAVYVAEAESDASSESEDSHSEAWTDEVSVAETEFDVVHHNVEVAHSISHKNASTLRRSTHILLSTLFHLTPILIAIPYMLST